MLGPASSDWMLVGWLSLNCKRDGGDRGSLYGRMLEGERGKSLASREEKEIFYGTKKVCVMLILV
jgi:hypothetical protein